MACLPVKIKIPAEEAHREILQKFEELQASTGKCANVLWALEHSIVKKLYKLSNNGLPSDFDPYKHASINYVIPNTPHKLCEINPKWTLLDTNGKEAGGKAGKSGSGRGRGGGGAKKQRKAPEASAPTTDKLDDANGSQQIAKTVQDKLPFTAPEAGKAALAQTKRKNKQMREAEGIVSVPHSSDKNDGVANPTQLYKECAARCSNNRRVRHLWRHQRRNCNHRKAAHASLQGTSRRAAVQLGR